MPEDILQHLFQVTVNLAQPGQVVVQLRLAHNVLSVEISADKRVTWHRVQAIPIPSDDVPALARAIVRLGPDRKVAQ